MDKRTTVEVDMEGRDIPTTKPRPAKRQGKQSRNRNAEKYRARVNTKVYEERIRDINKRLGLLDLDESGQLERIVNEVQLTEQVRATQLSVATRGVGLAVTVFYDRAATTWNLNQIAEIASIYQVFRVCLWLFHYKVYLAEQIQVKPKSGRVFQHVEISREIETLLHSVAEVPSLVSLVLGNVGMIEVDEETFHMGYAPPPTDAPGALEYSELCVNPTNIRSIIELLSNVETPEAARIEYQQYCCIPGARFNMNLLINADDIYPAIYGVPELREDVNAFKNLLTRVQPRLPKHAILPISWNGKAQVGGLWCSPRSTLRIESVFKSADDCATMGKRTRSATGQAITVPPITTSRYQRSKVVSEETNCWSLKKTPHSEIVTGVASLVGEECFLHTRYELNAKRSASLSAADLMYSLSNAPR